MSQIETPVRNDRSQAGFALLMALMCIVLLTFLGLTLAATTSTELQIATNYRWSQQAYFNAEAGMEAGKALLRNLNWADILPVPRTVVWDPYTAASPLKGHLVSPKFGGNPSDFESWQCDVRGDGMGYGVVLADGLGTFYADYGDGDNSDTIFNQTLNGAFTLWIRRPYQAQGTGYVDSPADDTLILTSRGVAPGAQGATGTALANRSFFIMEATLTREITPPCARYSGQQGGGPEGAGFGGCDPLKESEVARGLGIVLP